MSSDCIVVLHYVDSGVSTGVSTRHCMSICPCTCMCVGVGRAQVQLVVT